MKARINVPDNRIIVYSMYKLHVYAQLALIYIYCECIATLSQTTSFDVASTLEPRTRSDKIECQRFSPLTHSLTHSIVYERFAAIPDCRLHFSPMHRREFSTCTATPRGTSCMQSRMQPEYSSYEQILLSRVIIREH